MWNHYTDKIVETLVRPIWLFENIFWKYANQIAYNNEKEMAKKILAEVYWYVDIYDFFPSEIDEEKMNKTLNTIFNYYDYKNEWLKNNNS